MNNLDKQYQELLQDILDNGVEKKDRTGTGTLSVFGRQIRHKMSEGYPLLTTKKMYFKGIVVELLWFLRGDTNIKYLIDNDCHIWDGDAYNSFLHNPQKTHLYASEAGQLLICPTMESFVDKIKTDDEFAKKWGDLGPIYGHQWRNWGSGALEDKYLDNIDQIQNLIEQLKTNPDSRRLMVNAWNVGELDQMTLPPCHYGFQVYTRELTTSERVIIFRSKSMGPKLNFDIIDGKPVPPKKTEVEHYDEYIVPKRAISLMWNQRSVDTFLGLPFNIASYGLLLEIIAKEVNMVPDELIGNLGDVHLYKNHIEQSKEQIGRELSMEEKEEWCRNNSNHMDCPMHTREPMKLPILNILHNIDLINIKDGKQDRFEKAEAWIEGYQSHPTIKAPLNN